MSNMGMTNKGMWRRTLFTTLPFALIPLPFEFNFPPWNSLKPLWPSV